jgi:glucan phosphoethanolaminetransferase (alkaline phosphatase superfamily)
MQEKENQATKLNVGIFTIIFFVIFGISLYLSLPILDRHTPLWFLGPIGFIIILIFDVVYPFVITILLRKNKNSKMLFIILGLAISTAVLVWLIIGKLNFFNHMFG